MDSFAFIIHPIDPKRDVSRKFPLLGWLLNAHQINFFSTFFPPVYISQIDGLRSEATGKEVRGWFVACPLTPGRMLELPEKTVYRKIVQTGKLAERLGAQVLGLGAFTSVVGDAGVTIARQLAIPVTTGDSYTVAIAVEAVRAAAQQMDIPLAGATAAVMGATGAVGAAAAATFGDAGIDDAFMKSLGETLTPGSSALFVVVRKSKPEQVLERLKPFAGRCQILQCNMSAENEALLRNLLEVLF